MDDKMHCYYTWQRKFFGPLIFNHKCMPGNAKHITAPANKYFNERCLFFFFCGAAGQRHHCDGNGRGTHPDANIS